MVVPPPPVHGQLVSLLGLHTPLQLYWPLGQETGHGAIWHQPPEPELFGHQTWPLVQEPAVVPPPPVGGQVVPV